MRRKVLAVTVGGEPDPIVKTLEQHNPDFTIFFVTTEPAGGSRRFLLEETEKGEPIPKRARLALDTYEVITLPNPDDFAGCLELMLDALEEHSEAVDRLADYTGGTKTMSAALVVAALLNGWSLSLVTGERRDTVKVAKGTELARRVRTAPFFVTQTLLHVQTLYKRHEFASAAGLLNDLLAKTELPSKEAERLTTLHTFLQSLAAWDRFAYDEAYSLLRTVGKLWDEGCEFLAQIRRRTVLSVSDLVGNACRRADQARYEDAVLRLYRAVELLAQLRLKLQYAQDTSDLNLDDQKLSSLPPDLMQRLRERKERDSRAWVGLLEACEILAALGDPVGQVFREHQAPIRDLLSQRNRLFLTHGLSPIARTDWERSHELAVTFLGRAFAALNLTFSPLRFPSWEEVWERIQST